MNRSASGIASLIAALILCVLTVLKRPDFAFTHADIISGDQLLSATQRENYVAYVRRNLVCDSTYLMLQILVWCGLASVVARKNTLTAALVLCAGTLGACLDFTENTIRWSFLTSSSSPSATIAFVWSVVFGMSFWFMVIAAIVGSTTLWSQTLISKLTVIVGLFAIPAASLIFSVGFKPLFVWMIVWHIVIGIFLLRHTTEEG